MSGLIAEALALPLLVVLATTAHHPVRWPFVVAAAGTIFAAVVCLALFVVLAKPPVSEDQQPNIWFGVVCLAMTALGFVAMAAPTMAALYLPAVLIGVGFVCVIGDRRMLVSTALYTLVLVGVVEWTVGVSPASIASAVGIYSCTIAVTAWMYTRTVGTLNTQVNFQGALERLNDAFDGVGHTTKSSADTVEEVLRRGITLVTTVLPADRVGIFVRSETLGRFSLVDAWPQIDERTEELSHLPALLLALRSNSVVLDHDHCVIPVGYCSEGELAMVIERAGWDGGIDERAHEAASCLATAFLRRTSRANFISGLRAESRTDPLTGLANRRSMMERIEIEMARAMRSDTPLSLAMVDLDYFKRFNDQFGHVAGDTVLRSVAAVLVSNVRSQDMVARYGGEEFCLILPDTDIEGAHHLLDELRHGGRTNTTSLGVTISAGITSWDGIEDITSIIERADQALYRAKETGRNRVVSIQAFTEF